MSHGRSALGNQAAVLILTVHIAQQEFLAQIFWLKKKNIMGTRKTKPKNTPKDTTKKTNKDTIINLPDVEDIPGQEHIKPLPPGEMADTTISSADEEGEGLWDDENNGPDNVSASERRSLQQSITDFSDLEQKEATEAGVDQRDEDGELLNEHNEPVDLGAEDLDIPDEFEDDEDEDIGKEPKEYWSRNQNHRREFH